MKTSTLKMGLMKLVGFMSMAWISVMHSAYAQNNTPLAPTDLTRDTSNGKTAATVAGNIANTAEVGATLLIKLVTIGGFVVVALSLWGLYKSSKDEREKPMSAFAGLFIGGLMAGVGTVMWIMKNSTIGA